MSSYVRFSTTVCCVAALALVGAAIVQQPAALAQCTGDPSFNGETLPTKYAGMPATPVLQDQPTSFGNVSEPVLGISPGSELDRLFLNSDASNLYIGVTGNLPQFDSLENTLILFIDIDDAGPATMTLDTAGCCAGNHTPGCNAFGLGAPGEICETCVCAILPDCCGTEWNDDCASRAILSCSVECAPSCDRTFPRTSSAALKGIDGVTLDFAPEYAIALWNEAATQYGVLIDLAADPNLAGTALTLSTEFAVDNSNLAGVDDEAANDPTPQSGNAVTASTGYELAIPLASLGGIVAGVDTIQVQALLVGGSGYISNQSLPPLDGTSGGKGCVGDHDPILNIVDFSNDVDYPGLQHVAYALAAAGTPPILDGVSIPLGFGEVSETLTSVAEQNNHTCFTNSSPITQSGSELDQMFVSRDANKLYIGITGNIPSDEGTRNTLYVFIDTHNGFGTTTLATALVPGGSGGLPNLHGVSFDAGFAPDWVIEYWRTSAAPQHNARLQNLAFPAVFYDFTFTTDAVQHQTSTLFTFASNLSNLDGVNDVAGDDPTRQGVKALTATAGMQFSIPLVDLNLFEFSPPVGLAAGIVSGSGYISNQWLPPLHEPVPAETNISNDSIAPTLLLSDAYAGDVARTSSASQTGVGAGGTPSAIARATHVEMTVNLTHAAMDEVKIDVTFSPTDPLQGDINAILWDRNQVGANMNTTFAGDGVGLLSVDLDWVAPGAAGTYEATGLLSFNGVDPTAGTWTLYITDNVTGNVGTLNSWSIDITEDVGGNVDCLGNHDETLDTGTGLPINDIDFNDTVDYLDEVVRFPGDQFALIDLAVAGGAPTVFSGTGIPNAYSLTGAVGIVQNNYTCFGDSAEAPPIHPVGSELDQLFVTNTADTLQVAVTGNLENNKNAWIFLFDTNPATGLSTIAGITSPPQPLGGSPGLNGVTLDPGFKPDIALTINRQDDTQPADDYSIRMTDLNTNTTTSIGRFKRNVPNDGVLLAPVPNGNGSELDELFVRNDANNLYLGITGNLESGSNRWVIFLDTVSGNGLTNILSTAYTGVNTVLSNINGDAMDATFEPDYALVMGRPGGAYFVDLWDMSVTTPVVLTGLAEHASGQPVAAGEFSGDNSNVLGVNANSLDDPAQQMINAATATTGLQIALDRASIGNPLATDTIKVGVYLIGQSGWWSNQTLAGLGGGAGSLQDPPVPDLFTVPGDQFASYAIADVPGYWTPTDVQFDGSGIPTDMGGTAVATQDNYTQWGDQALPASSGNPNCMLGAFNDSNTKGVTDVTATPAEAASASTGMEFDIPFADLGLVADQTLRMMVILGSNDGWLSNQVLPPVVSLQKWPQFGTTGDLGGPRPGDTLDLGNEATAPGVQYLSYTLTSGDPCAGSGPADLDASGTVDLLDVAALVDVLLEVNTDTGTCEWQKADLNGDTNRDGLDIQSFVDQM